MSRHQSPVTKSRFIGMMSLSPEQRDGVNERSGVELPQKSRQRVKRHNIIDNTFLLLPVLVSYIQVLSVTFVYCTKSQ